MVPGVWWTRRGRPSWRVVVGLVVAAAVGLAGPVADGAGLVSGPPRAASASTGRTVLDDEFNGPAGSLPDRRIWQIQTGGGRWGNAEQESYTASPRNVSLDGHGHLVITARRQASGGFGYTSGRIASLVPVPPYGHFEARIKMAPGFGVWPTFWLMGVDPNGVTWPYTGEIDIAEVASRLPNVQFATVHGPSVTAVNTARPQWQIPFLLRYPRPLTGAFHTYAVDTTPTTVTFSFDGRPYQKVTVAQTPRGGVWSFNNPYYVILNLAVGGFFAGNPPRTTRFPTSMLVDDVRVRSS